MSLFKITVYISVFIGIAYGQDFIIFPHDFHVEDIELECEICHEDISESVSIRYRLLPEKDICLDCHDGDGAPDDCDICHNNEDEPTSFRPLRNRLGPDFSHNHHLTVKPDCFTCHSHILSDDGSSPPPSWQLQDCKKCHENEKPGSHQLDWITIHGMEVNHVSQQNCNLCHTQAGCDACHILQQFESNVHPVGWLLAHGLESIVNDTDCMTCHHIKEDCQSCHRENYIMPMSHNFPGWVESVSSFTDGGLHASEALSSPNVCQTCHDTAVDPTCQRCHSG